MSDQTKDGGPAFPVPDASQNQSTGETVMHQGYFGISVRDYFAAKALQGLIAHPIGREPRRGQTTVEAQAEAAFEYADAMLAAREAKS